MWNIFNKTSRMNEYGLRSQGWGHVNFVTYERI